MLRMMKFELKRAAGSRFFAAAILIGCVITLADIFDAAKFLRFIEPYPPSLYQYSMLTRLQSALTTVYFMTAPLLAAIPFADSYYCDRQGYLKQIYTRTTRKSYLISKYLAVFISGGTAFALPLIVNFIAVACLCPALAPQAVTGAFAVSEFGLMSVLFINHPLIYCVVYILLDFTFAGLLAAISLMTALFVKNRFAVLLSPFILYLLWGVLSGITGYVNYDIGNLMRASAGYFPCETAFSMIFTILMLFLISFPLYYIKGGADDVL